MFAFKHTQYKCEIIVVNTRVTVQQLLTLADRLQGADGLSAAGVLLIATEGKLAFTALQQ